MTEKRNNRRCETKAAFADDIWQLKKVAAHGNVHVLSWPE